VLKEYLQLFLGKNRRKEEERGSAWFITVFFLHWKV
jgi:hypothetical protein